MSLTKCDESTNKFLRDTYNKCSFFIPFASRNFYVESDMSKNNTRETINLVQENLSNNKSPTDSLSNSSTVNATRSIGGLIRKTNKKELPANLDDILKLAGSFGFYQRLQFLLVGFLAIIPSMVAYSYVFVSATPKFACKTVLETKITQTGGHKFTLQGFLTNGEDYDDDDPFKQLKLEKSEYLIETRRFISLLDANANASIVYDNSCKIDVKKLFPQQNLKSNNKTQHKLDLQDFKCVEWVYDDSVYGSTTVTDWNLVCLKSHLKALTQNTFILGNTSKC